MEATSKLSFASLLKDYAELVKVRITIAVTVTCGIGFVLANGSLKTEILIPIIGTFLTACGSAALNQYQEYQYDIYMKRTRNRPIPAKRLSPLHVLVYSLVLSISGLWFLYQFGNTDQAFLGLLALFFYNIVYTPMKRWTTFAVFPGAVIGGITPIIGWVSAGGNMLDPKILALGFFIFIWQIPHFWLLILIYSKEYQEAGYPTMIDKMTTSQLARITYLWIMTLVTSCIMFPLFRISDTLIVNLSFVPLGAWLAWKSKIIFDGQDRQTIRKIFMSVNMYVLIVLFTLLIDELIN